MKDLRILPKFRDGLSYLYIEHCKIEKDKQSIAIFDKEGKIQIPIATLALLLLGPGTSITHDAITVLADSGVLVVWTGEEAIRFYSQGFGKSRSSSRLIFQAKLVSNPQYRLDVVKNMYHKRFKEDFTNSISIQQLRGMEGARVRKTYADASKKTGVEWTGRNYDRKNWPSSDAVNISISCANSCLYGLCHAAIVSAGFSPSLGFIHTGKMLSFVYDIADLYKTELIIPIAFDMAKEGRKNIESRTRKACRELFKEMKLIIRIIPDIMECLTIQDESNNILTPEENLEGDSVHQSEDALPEPLWDPEQN